MIQTWMRCGAAISLMLVPIATALAEHDIKHLSADFKKKCGVRVHWNFDKELGCQAKFNDHETPEYCSRMLFLENEYQCIITTKPKLTHDTLGEAVRSCLLKLPETCR